MQTSSIWHTARRFMSSAARKDDKISSLNQQVMNEYMIPGRFLRYFKTPRRKKRSLEASPSATFEKVHKESARSVHEHDVAPTATQQQFAQRIQRGLNNMYSYEMLPRWVTPSNVGIQSVKVARNLRKCQVFYEAKGSSKEERGNVHRALAKHAGRLESMIRTHAGIRRPMTIKFVADKQTTDELESIFEAIAFEQEQQKQS